MASSPGWIRSFMTAATLVIVWVLLLTLAMKGLLGARVSGSWVIVGVLITAGAIWLVLMVKELTEAILDNWQESQNPPSALTRSLRTRKLSFSEIHPKTSRGPSFHTQRRLTLGLQPRLVLANRRRTSR